MKFDFTRPELDYILENANFTEEQEQIFRMLTGRQRQTVNSKYIYKNEYVRKYG